MRLLFLRMIWLVLGALTALLLLEGLFRLLPVSMGLYRTEDFEHWPLRGYQPYGSYTYSITWQMLNAHHGKTNNYGHLSPFEYRKGSHPLVVIGDSFVESQMNRHEETLQGQLGELLGSRESVYGLGFAGMSASDYLSLSRLAKDEFAPVAAVFVIVDGDISESLLASLGRYYFVPQGDSFRLEYRPLYGKTLMKVARNLIGEVSLYRYIFGNLGFSFDELFGLNGRKEQPQSGRREENSEIQRRVIDYFLSELPQGIGVPPQCIAFVVDSDRYAIYNPASPSQTKETADMRSYFLFKARILGFAVSDLDLAFRERYKQDRTKFDYWPIDRHWNRTGHGLAAEEVYRLLFSSGKQECRPNRR